MLSGKDTPPASTLHSRPRDQQTESTPAPGDYNPEKSEKVIHDASPKYTFGLKTQVEKTSSTPGMYHSLWVLQVRDPISWGIKSKLQPFQHFGYFLLPILSRGSSNSDKYGPSTIKILRTS